MSYCRFSSDDFQCDVYVWADVSGTWRTEVAGRRWIYTTPLPERVPFTPDRIEEWAARWRTVTDQHGDPAHGHWIDLPELDEHSFDHATPDECADNLERLRGLGFNVPQSAIDALRDEATP